MSADMSFLRPQKQPSSPLIHVNPEYPPLPVHSHLWSLYRQDTRDRMSMFLKVAWLSSCTRTSFSLNFGGTNSHGTYVVESRDSGLREMRVSNQI